MPKRCEPEFRKACGPPLFVQARWPTWPKSCARPSRPLHATPAQRAPRNAPQAYRRRDRWPNSPHAAQATATPLRSCETSLAPQAIDARVPISAPQRAPELPIGTPKRPQATLMQNSSCNCCPTTNIGANRLAPHHSSLSRGPHTSSPKPNSLARKAFTASPRAAHRHAAPATRQTASALLPRWPLCYPQPTPGPRYEPYQELSAYRHWQPWQPCPHAQTPTLKQLRPGAMPQLLQP